MRSTDQQNIHISNNDKAKLRNVKLTAEQDLIIEKSEISNAQDDKKRQQIQQGDCFPFVPFLGFCTIS